MSNNPPDPFIGVQMHENRTATGRRSSTPAKQATLYFAYGREQQNQFEGKQRGEWWGPDGRIHEHETVMAWAKQEALRHRYTFQAILSVPQAELNPEQFCQAMAQSQEISEWRLMMHQDTKHRHAHVLFFRDKRLDKKSFLAWQTAVRQELSRMEQQQLALPHSPERQQEMQPEMVLDSESTHSRQQEVGLGW